MGRRIRTSPQTLALLEALLHKPTTWHHGYALSQQTGLASGTLYPILMRLEKLRWLETSWEQPGTAQPPAARHAISTASLPKPAPGPAKNSPTPKSENSGNQP
jgi:DNA-binding PadR family transcriptional regulator